MQLAPVPGDSEHDSWLDVVRHNRIGPKVPAHPEVPVDHHESGRPSCRCAVDHRLLLVIAHPACRTTRRQCGAGPDVSDLVASPYRLDTATDSWYADVRPRPQKPVTCAYVPQRTVANALPVATDQKVGGSSPYEHAPLTSGFAFIAETSSPETTLRLTRY